jgi:hypothetical protein
MPDSPLFIEVARQQGYTAEAAYAALEAVRARLAALGLSATRFYIYRTGESGVAGGGAAGSATGRPRVLLAFPSADAALAFAQHGGLGRSPRLIALSLSQALAALIQRPSIGALYLAEDGELMVEPGALPPGLRLERTALIELLDGVTF